MNVYSNISYIAKLIDDPTRSTILECLIDGKALPAGELAYSARISTSTITSHLNKLVEGGLLTVEQHGRHHYYRITNKEVGRTIEKLVAIAPKKEIRSLKQSELLKQVSFARTCYDHLAGELGVIVAEALIEKDYILIENNKYVVTEKGKPWFKLLGIKIEDGEKKRRIFAKPCLDWSERHYHISGWLGSEIASKFFAEKWIIREKNSRAVELTNNGKRQLQKLLGLNFE